MLRYITIAVVCEQLTKSRYMFTQRHLWYTCLKKDISNDLNCWIKQYGLYPGKTSFLTC